MPTELEKPTETPQQPLKLGLYLGAQNPTNTRPSLAPKPPYAAANGQGAAAVLRARPGLPARPPAGTANEAAAGSAAPAVRTTHGASSLITKPRPVLASGLHSVAAAGTAAAGDKPAAAAGNGVAGDAGAAAGAEPKYDFSSAPRGVRHRYPSNNGSAASAGGAGLDAGRRSHPGASAGGAVASEGGAKAGAGPAAAHSAPGERPAFEEDPETAASVKKWLRKLQDFKAMSPDALEFIYLRHAHAEVRNPYNLVIVTHADIKANAASRNNYYTMSVKGVTHFAEGSGEFITLEQFEREYFLYRQLLRFRTFVQFRLWKAFKIWRRFVSSRKARSAKEVLQKSLFMLNPVFRVALVRMRTACHGLQQLRLHAVERGQLYGLPQLVSLHAARHQDTKAALEQFEHDIVAQAQEACVAAMQRMEDQLLGVKANAAASGNGPPAGLGGGSGGGVSLGAPGVVLGGGIGDAMFPDGPLLPPIAEGPAGGPAEGGEGAAGAAEAASGEGAGAGEGEAAATGADGGSSRPRPPADDGTVLPPSSTGMADGEAAAAADVATPAAAAPAAAAAAGGVTFAASVAAGGAAAAHRDTDGAASTVTGYTAATSAARGRGGRGGGGYAHSMMSYNPAELMAGGDFSYALNAARRSYKRRIHAFVRLLDYMVCGALHGLLMDSSNDILAALSPRPTRGPSELGEPADADAIADVDGVTASAAAAAHGASTSRRASSANGLSGGDAAAPMVDLGEAAALILGEEVKAPPKDWGVDGGQFLQLAVQLQAVSPPQPSARGSGAVSRVRTMRNPDGGAEGAGVSAHNSSSQVFITQSKSLARGLLAAGSSGSVAGSMNGTPGNLPALSHELVLVPPPGEFVAALEKIHSTWAGQIQSVARLLTHPNLQDYMERPVDAGFTPDMEGFTDIVLGQAYSDSASAVLGRLRAVMEDANGFKATFEPIKSSVLALKPVDEAGLRLAWESGRRDLEAYRRDLTSLRDQLQTVMDVPQHKQLNVLRVELSELVAALRPAPERALASLSDLLPRLAFSAYNSFISAVHSATRRLNTMPTSADELSEFLHFLAECERNKAAMDREYDAVVAHYDLAEDFDIRIPDMQAAAYATLDRDYAALRDAMWAADSSRERLVETYGADLSRAVDAIAKQLAGISMQAQHDMILDERSDPDVVLAYTGKLVERVEGLKVQADKIQQHQRTFRLEETRFPELEDCYEDVALRHRLWTSVRGWAELTQGWLGERFDLLQPGAMEEAIGSYSRAVFKMERGLVPNKIVPKLRAGVNYWRDLVPLVSALRNPFLKERHWVKVNAAVGSYIDRNEELTLQGLLDINLLAAREAVSLISTEATQEAALEAMLDKVADKWRHVELSLKPYKALKETYVLGGVDEVLAVLEDSSMVMATISASRYVAGVRVEVEKLDRQLRLFGDTLDEWLDVQRQWLALEPILTAADIQRQLPSEARAFAAVDRQLKEVNRKAKDRPNALQAGTQPGLLEQLRRCNEALEGVAKNLEAYLEAKRTSFPRFYFLSNDELLQILSQARNPQAVQPHLQKCFDGIRSLDFGEEGRTNDILAMVSAEGERIGLSKNLKARGSVEQWLGSVEAAMRMAVRGQARRAHRDYVTGPGRWDWVRVTPAQLVVVVSNIHWCRAVEACLSRANGDPLTALGELHTLCASQLSDLTSVVRAAGITPLERKVLVTLITTDVHNRDVVDALISRGCTSAADFTWQMQLRYDYESPHAGGGGAGGGGGGGGGGGALAAAAVAAAAASGGAAGAAPLLAPGAGGHTVEGSHMAGAAGGLHTGGGGGGGGGGPIPQDEIVVRQVNAKFYYGWEYLGAQPRLVITPMTDRAYMTLTGALHMRLGGAPAGPAGTGKTETVKDLAKALGVQCVVFNCGDNLDFRFMGKFFSGLAQAGAWACFDEFNRIDTEVLSVVAQQLQAIQTALRAGVERFVFEGNDIRLLPSCGVFVTMNPGYAGRTELPDNLQALFRPMAMMVPDYALVAEVMLFSEGFEGARSLSRKMVQLYKLASEQLSQQDHYDFGMRALKSVLVTAGSLKRGSTGLPEETVLIRAMRESNIPKFLSEDARLFDAIVCDLFPGTDLPEQRNEELHGALVAACGVLGLQPVPPFVSKAIQLWDTFHVRFGAMLVGPPGGGKTCIYRTLAEAITRLSGVTTFQAAISEASFFLGGGGGHSDLATAVSSFPAKFAASPGGMGGGAGGAGGGGGGGLLNERSVAGGGAGADPDSPYHPVHTYVVNPKSISLGELYGSYNTATNEWQDGLASCIIRGAVVEGQSNPDLQWVVFDGPVDTVWVENMNTVLDDNCMLCLPNGERIKLDPASMRVLFEVADLVAASPATVSRCGMVYVTPDDMGWRPYVRSWMDRLPAIFHNALNPQDPAAGFASSTTGQGTATDYGEQGSPPAGHRGPSVSAGAAAGGDGVAAPGVNPFLAAAQAAAAGSPGGRGPAEALGAEASGSPPLARRPSAGVLQYLQGLFDKFLDPLLAHARKRGEAAVATCEVALVSATCSLLQTLLLSTQLQGHPGAEGASLRKHGAGFGLRAAATTLLGAASVAASHAAGGLGGAAAGGQSGAAASASAFATASTPYKDPLLDLTSEEPSETTQVALNYIFAFAAVWGVGGSLSPACWEAFDGAAKDLFEGTANYPGGSGTVFDYHLDYHKNFALTPWEAAVPAYAFRPEVRYFDILVPTADTTRYGALLSCLLAVNRPVLLTGPSGSGKSALVRSCLSRLQAGGGVIPTTVYFSAQTSAATVQAQLEGQLEKKRKRRFGAPAGRRLLLFVDDVNLPARDAASGAQPPIELLRHLQDFRGVYDRKKLFWKEVDDSVVLLAACGPPGGGRQEMSPRFVRHFSLLSMPPTSEVALRTIFGAIMGGFLDLHFPPDVRTRMLRPLVDTSVEVYSHVCAELLPTPAKSHYTFSLRDVSKAFQGMLAIRPNQCGPGDPRGTLMRLWVHEHMRVYHDRLVNDVDKSFFKGLLYDLLRMRFDTRDEYDKFFSPASPILFGDFLKRGGTRDERVYAEVRDVPRLGRVLEGDLDEYNAGGSGPRMDLVLFMDAVEHITRIARILRQPRGNAMLVGVGGSGKQSLARFAAFLADTQVFTLELSRGYGVVEFREDIKKLYRLAGIEGKPVAFLLPEQHIVLECFVEDVSNLVSSGEITGLFGTDEREKIFGDLRSWAAAQGLEDTREAMWRAFVDRVRDNLHLVLALSPVGEAFRERCRRFPSLLAATSVDWFSEWPQEALMSVSTRFLEQQELGGPGVMKALAQACVDIHTSVVAAASRYYLELRRRYYVTPRFYLDLLHLYTSLLAARRQETAVARERLLGGVSKLTATNTTVEEMRTALRLLQPVLADKTEATQRLLEQVTHEQYEAEHVRAAVAGEEADVKAQAAKLAALKDEAQADLEEVLPALEAAERALSALNKTDIIEIKTFTKPPALVQTTMEAVCILLQERADWDTAKRLLGEATFIKRLMEYDRDNIPDKVVRSLKRVIDDPTFTPDQVAKQSKAAQSLCLWVRAMDTYARVIRVVEPKRAALATAQERLGAMNGALLAKQRQLGELEARVATLQEQLQSTQEELHSLQHQAELSQRRLVRAEKLTGALADESVRWAAQAERMTTTLHLLVGDVFLAAAAVSYLGAFTGPYRDALVRGWVARCRAASIPMAVAVAGGEPFNLAATLATPVQIRDWGMQGLPTDSLSVDNGVLVTRGSRWPLCIDPQDQAGRWIKAMELKNNIRCIRMSDSAPGAGAGGGGGSAVTTSGAAAATTSGDKAAGGGAGGAGGGGGAAAAAAAAGLTGGSGGGLPLHLIEQCVRLGQPVLLEDVGEGQLDPALEPLLTKATYTQGTRLLLKLGDVEVDYDPRFRLYLATRLPNPHYLPEVCIKVNLINFTVTPKGLEDQLLGDVVRHERPDLEEAKDRLVVSLSADKRQLGELEDRILQLLQQADAGGLLDDEQLIATLNDAKQTSGIIATRVAEAEATERAINEAREVYRPVPARGSLLYFVTAELSAIDPMYQTSLAAFVRMFGHCLDAAPRADDLAARLRVLMDTTTDYVYRSVCRGLFDSHKLLYSFLISAAVERQAGVVSPAEWNYLLRGGRGAAAAAGGPASGASGGGYGAGGGGGGAAFQPFGQAGAAAGAAASFQLPVSAPPEMAAWAPPGCWDALVALEAAVPHVFGGLPMAVAAHPDAWRSFAESPAPDRLDASQLLFTPGATPAASAATSMSGAGTATGMGGAGGGRQLAGVPEGDEGEEGGEGPVLARSISQVLPEGGGADVPARLTAFQMLLLVKVFCEGRLLAAIRRYVSGCLGPAFTEPPPASLPELFTDSSPATPIIFILSQGVDPSPAIRRFATSQGRSAAGAPGRGLHMISLGQGQGPRAEALIAQAVKAGDWVCLQNCHLAASWMPRLERLVEELQARYSKQIQFSNRLGLKLGSPDGPASPAHAHPAPSGPSASGASTSAPATSLTAEQLLAAAAAGASPLSLYDVHPDFRLWLTSMPTPAFPVPVLQSAVKTTMEAPKGVRANLLRIYGELSDAVLQMGRGLGAGPGGGGDPSDPSGHGTTPPDASASLPSAAGTAAGASRRLLALQLAPPPRTPPSVTGPDGSPLPLHVLAHQMSMGRGLLGAAGGKAGAAADAVSEADAMAAAQAAADAAAVRQGGQPASVAAAVGPQWRKLLLSCALFHAVLQERRRFGPLGWNVRYEFSDGDLSAAMRTLQMFLVEGAAAASTSASPGAAGAGAAGLTGMRPAAGSRGGSVFDATPPWDLRSGGLSAASLGGSGVGGMGGVGGGGGVGLSPGSSHGDIPWDALQYVTGDIVYGGRVTDENDRRLLSCLLRRFYTPAVLRDGYAFCPSTSLPGGGAAAGGGGAAGAGGGGRARGHETAAAAAGAYRQPLDGDHGWYMSYCRSLPYSDSPEVFGLHANADIRLQLQESRTLLDTVLSIQPRVVASTAADGMGAPATPAHAQAADPLASVGGSAVRLPGGVPGRLSTSVLPPPGSGAAAAHVTAAAAAAARQHRHTTSSMPAFGVPNSAPGAVYGRPSSAAPLASAPPGLDGGGFSGPGGGGFAERTADDITADLAAEIAGLLPPPLTRESAATGAADPFAPLPSGHDNSLGVVLTQEMERLNALRALLAKSLDELGRALRGLAVSSAELEAMATALLNNQVPPAWRRAAYPSTKPLASWVNDFRRRVEHLRTWLTRGQPPAFWLPGLFFPQGFITAVLQNHARRTRVPIDRLAFDFKVLSPEADKELVEAVDTHAGAAHVIKAAVAAAGSSRGSSAGPGSRAASARAAAGSPGASGGGAGGVAAGSSGRALLSGVGSGSGRHGGPVEGGVYVYGLFLEGARWDEQQGLLSEARPGEMFCRLPAVHLLPKHTDALAAEQAAQQQQAAQRRATAAAAAAATGVGPEASGRSGSSPHRQPRGARHPAVEEGPGHMPAFKAKAIAKARRKAAGADSDPAAAAERHRQRLMGLLAEGSSPGASAANTDDEEEPLSPERSQHSHQRQKGGADGTGGGGGGSASGEAKAAADVPSGPQRYQCPLYKTSVRAGVLSTTGQSTNFVLHLGLGIPDATDPDFWVMQGVAALCALDD